MEDKINVLRNLQAIDPLSIPSDLAPIPEAAALARLTVATVRRRIRDGRLSCYGTPGNYRISLSELIPCRPATKPLYTPSRRTGQHLRTFWFSKGAQPKNREGKKKSQPVRRDVETPATVETAPEKPLTVQ
jgi:hypothetical protein